MADTFEGRQRGSGLAARFIADDSSSSKVGGLVRMHASVKKIARSARSEIAVSAVVALASLGVCGGVAAMASDVNGAVPNAPAGVGAPTHLVLDDEFNTGALNESLWSPTWFGNGQVSNNTVMEESNVAVGPNGLALTLAGNSTGGIVSTNPDDGQPGHTGFQIAPTPGHPVYVEYKATLPTTGGQIANWPALWLTGQNWPMTGEIDVMEGFGNAEWHGITGSSPSNLTNPGGAGALAAPLAGPHTFGVLWSTTGVTFVYDGVIVGSANITLTGPMYLLMENSLGAPAPSALPWTCATCGYGRPQRASRRQLQRPTPLSRQHQLPQCLLSRRPLTRPLDRLQRP